MTDFVKTLANSFNVLGPEYPSVWGSMVFGTDTWGAGSLNYPIYVRHYLGNTTTLTAEPSKNIRHITSGSELFLLSTPNKNVTRPITNSMPIGSEPVHEYMQDENGYFYQIPPETLDYEEKYTPSYISGTTATSGWTSGVASTTSWSSV